MKHIGPWSCLVVGLAGCASADSRRPAAAPTVGPAPGAASAEASAPKGRPRPQAPPPAADAPLPSGAPPSTFARADDALRMATREIDAAQRELDVAAGDCRGACRALASMDRAAGRLCRLAPDEPEPSRCSEAKQRVYSARDRVRATCGHCEGGPSLEHGAPIPSP